MVRLSSLPILVVSVCLLLLSLSIDSTLEWIALLIPTLLIALSFAVVVATLSLWSLCREHRYADSAFRNADREFFSIFKNALDGILITDDDANCLDANPSAAFILRLERTSLVGRSVRDIFGCNVSGKDWRTFLQRSGQRNRAWIVAGDGSSVLVDVIAAINYLPGRHIFIICDVTRMARTESALRQSEERFQYMAANIQEIVWTMDAESKQVVYANRAYATVTGQAIDSLYANPTSYRELIHPRDRIRVLARLHELAATGFLDEEFRFIHSSGATRWIWVKARAVEENGRTRWIVGTAQDITSRKEAEKQIAEHLDAVESARAEAEALRKSTLALSQNLAMDSVLDTLLHCLCELVPFDRATVLFVENGSELMVARESTHAGRKRTGLVLGASENFFLQKILFERKAVLLSDTEVESQWTPVSIFDHTRSWMGIPLTAAGSVIGLLSVSSQVPALFTAEHFRFAKSLAISAAVAIHNARVHERAEIYAAELELRLKELRETRTALQHARSNPGGLYSSD